MMRFGKWRGAVDKKSGRIYYYHTISKETSWVKPQEMIDQENRRKARKIKTSNKKNKNKLTPGIIEAFTSEGVLYFLDSDSKRSLELCLQKKNYKNAKSIVTQGVFKSPLANSNPMTSSLARQLRINKSFDMILSIKMVGEACKMKDSASRSSASNLNVQKTQENAPERKSAPAKPPPPMKPLRSPPKKPQGYDESAKSRMPPASPAARAPPPLHVKIPPQPNRMAPPPLASSPSSSVGIAPPPIPKRTPSLTVSTAPPPLASSPSSSAGIAPPPIPKRVPSLTVSTAPPPLSSRPSPPTRGMPPPIQNKLPPPTNTTGPLPPSINLPPPAPISTKTEAPSGRGNLLKAIQLGKKLKTGSERQSVPEAPPEDASMADALRLKLDDQRQYLAELNESSSYDDSSWSDE